VPKHTYEFKYAFESDAACNVSGIRMWGVLNNTVLGN